MSGQWVVISGLFVNLLATLCLSVDVVGTERVSKAVAIVHNYLRTSQRIVWRWAVRLTAILVALLLQFTELAMYLGKWLSDAMQQWGPVATFGLSILALALFLASMGKQRLEQQLKSIVSKAEWKKLDNLILDVLIAVVVGLGVAALATGNIVIQLFLLMVGMALAFVAAVLWLPSVFLTAVVKLIEFVHRPTATVRRFGVIGLALLFIGFLLQIIGISLIM